MSESTPNKTVTTPEDEALQSQEPGVAPEPAAFGTDFAADVPQMRRVSYQFGLNLRAGPGYEHGVLRVLSFGTEIPVFGDSVAIGDDIWVQTEGGWVDSSYLTEV